MKMKAILKSFSEKDRKYVNERKSLDQAHFRSKLKDQIAYLWYLSNRRLSEVRSLFRPEWQFLMFPKGSVHSGRVSEQVRTRKRQGRVTIEIKSNPKEEPLLAQRVDSKLGRERQRN